MWLLLIVECTMDNNQNLLSSLIGVGSSFCRNQAQYPDQEAVMWILFHPETCTDSLVADSHAMNLFKKTRVPIKWIKYRLPSKADT